jgi:hypothetical protein
VKQTRGLSILIAGALKFLRAMRCLDRARLRLLFFLITEKPTITDVYHRSIFPFELEVLQGLAM